VTREDPRALGRGIILCSFVTLVGLGTGIASLIPPLAKELRLDPSVFFTSLSGAAVFGGFALWGLRHRRVAMAREAARWGTVAPDALTNEDQVPLASGPGLTVRWLMAVPVMLVATVLPSLGQVAVLTWGRLSSDESLTFSAAFGDSVGNLAYAVIVPAFALLVFLVHRTTFAVWPKTCLWLAVWALVPTTVLITAIDDVPVLPNIAFGAGLVWLNHELGKLVLWRLSRPVTRDLALSTLEIPYRVPGEKARLRVRHDGLLLDKLGDRSLNRVIRWPELTRVRVERVHKETVWDSGPRGVITVPTGHALRVTGTAAEWLLPVPQLLGENLAAAIVLRATTQQGTTS
jgi:hypothetical protein